MARLPGSHPGAPHCLVGRGQRVGDDRHLRQLQAGVCQPGLVDRAQAARRHHDVAGKAALDVVAGHLLLRADGGQTAPAQIAFAAGQHRRHDHRLVGPGLGTGATGHHPAADLVAQRQRQRVLGAHAVVVVAQVGVAHAAAGHGHGDFAGPRHRVEDRAFERCANGLHQPTVGFDVHEETCLTVRCAAAIVALWYRNAC